MDAPVALITAGTAGLGAATARLLARNGFRVVVNYNSDHARANAFVNELTKISTLPRRNPFLVGLNIESPNFCSYQADLPTAARHVFAISPASVTMSTRTTGTAASISTSSLTSG